MQVHLLLRCLLGAAPLLPAYRELVPAVPPAPPQVSGTQPLLMKQELTIRQVHERAAKATAAVTLLDSLQQEVGQGTAFHLGAGYYATNWHVVATGHTGRITRADGTTLPILGIVASSENDDLVILATPFQEGAYLELDPELPGVGDRIVVIGSPLGLTGTLSEGIISGHRQVGGSRRLQLTAPISPGSSGSPVLSMRGRVVGIASSTIVQGQSLNFAVPAGLILPLLPDPIAGDAKVQPLSEWSPGAVTETEREFAKQTYRSILQELRSCFQDVMEQSGNAFVRSRARASCELLSESETLPWPQFARRGHNELGWDPDEMYIKHPVLYVAALDKVRVLQLQSLCSEGLERDPHSAALLFLKPKLYPHNTLIGDFRGPKNERRHEQAELEALSDLYTSGFDTPIIRYELAKIAAWNPMIFGPRLRRDGERFRGHQILALLDGLEHTDPSWTHFGASIAYVRAWGHIATADEERDPLKYIVHSTREQVPNSSPEELLETSRRLQREAGIDLDRSSDMELVNSSIDAAIALNKEALRLTRGNRRLRRNLGWRGGLYDQLAYAHQLCGDHSSRAQAYRDKASFALRGARRPNADDTIQVQMAIYALESAGKALLLAGKPREAERQRDQMQDIIRQLRSNLSPADARSDHMREFLDSLEKSVQALSRRIEEADT